MAIASRLLCFVDCLSGRMGGMTSIPITPIMVSRAEFARQGITQRSRAGFVAAVSHASYTSSSLKFTLATAEQAVNRGYLAEPPSALVAIGFDLYASSMHTSAYADDTYYR